jgi:hypothetical protein
MIGYIGIAINRLFTKGKKTATSKKKAAASSMYLLKNELQSKPVLQTGHKLYTRSKESVFSSNHPVFTVSAPAQASAALKIICLIL